VVLSPAFARADDPRFGPYDVRSTFVIAKNLDRDVVEYGIHLDKDCLPIGDEPMYAYWRQYEQGPNVTEDLNLLDRTVYGIGKQSVLSKGGGDSRLSLTVKAAPDRPVTIIVKKVEGKCTAEPLGKISGQVARLTTVFVHVAGWMSVDWVEIRGLLNGQPIVERVKH
jgi:hypothetical protein